MRSAQDIRKIERLSEYIGCEKEWADEIKGSQRSARPDDIGH